MLAQLGNRVQHALRAYTPREQKAVTTAADTFRPNPDFNAAEVIKTLGVGEALVSTLEKKGIPSIVQRTLMRPPSSRLGPITDAERRDVMSMSPVGSQYDKTIDRESAFEVLAKRAQDAARAEEEEQMREERGEEPRRTRTGFQLPDFGDSRRSREDDRYDDRRDDRYDDRYERAPSRSRSRAPSSAPRRTSSSGRQTVAEAAIKTVTRTVASSLGRALVRGILGSLKKGR